MFDDVAKATRQFLEKLCVEGPIQDSMKFLIVIHVIRSKLIFVKCSGEHNTENKLDLKRKLGTEMTLKIQVQ